MTKAEAIAEIVRRADQARTPIYKLCARPEARVAPSTFTRWRKEPEGALWSTIGKLEDALAAVERERTA